MADINPLEMSDEDILKMSEPPVVEASTEAVVETPVVETPVVETPVVETPAVEEPNKGGEETPKVETEVEPGTEGPEAKTEGETEGGAEKPKEKTAEELAAEAAAKPEGEKPAEVQVDYKAEYEKLLSPIKANGKDIQINSPEELVKLAQMGANYTRKMQELAPVRKTMLMLQNNDLLDEDKLSFLIDLDKGNPEAIKKFIKDRNINVLDIDTESEPAYVPGSHQVSEPEVAFRTTMDDLKSTPKGTETLSEIHSNWDDTSKQAIWNDPSIMTVIHEQRETGVYDQIKAEVDRRITIGLIPASTPFLQAYQVVGTELATKANEAAEAARAAKVLGTRPAPVKEPVANGDKASAASPTRAAPKQANTVVNPLNMPDEEFMKQANFMEGRL